MHTASPRSAEEQAALARYKDLTEQVLPAMAREQHWPVHFDHCFKRICLDFAFEDIWYRHLAKPAERHIAGPALQRALACAEEIAAGGVAVLQQRDAASLRVRGKRPKQHARADTGA